LIWDRLDGVRAKHPDMILLHGGSPKGAELIAAKMGDPAQGAADRLQAGLDQAQAVIVAALLITKGDPPALPGRQHTVNEIPSMDQRESI
jgi:hypothetical protein